MIFPTSMMMFHVNLPGCKFKWNPGWLRLQSWRKYHWIVENTLWRGQNDSTYGFMSHFDSSWECLNWLNALASVLYGFVAWLFTSINYLCIYVHISKAWNDHVFRPPHIRLESCVVLVGHRTVVIILILLLIKSSKWFHNNLLGTSPKPTYEKSENRTFPRKNHLDRVVSN